RRSAPRTMARRTLRGFGPADDAAIDLHSGHGIAGITTDAKSKTSSDLLLFALGARGDRLHDQLPQRCIVASRGGIADILRTRGAHIVLHEARTAFGVELGQGFDADDRGLDARVVLLALPLQLARGREDGVLRTFGPILREIAAHGLSPRQLALLGL